jgi:sterol desaturase/sphingolipid hydroxylase (fatty acid hydroxylase superfamily)
MYPADRNPNAGRKPAGAQPQGETALRQAWQVFRRSADSFLLIIGAVALLLLIPMLWLWIAYGGVHSPGLVWAGGVGLSALTAGIGLAMIRILDGPP